jgi:hypothetical protein
VSDVNAKPQAGMKPLQALMMLPAVIVVIIAFIALNAAAGSHEFYIGFFFLLYWASVEHSKMSALLPSALGSAFGLTLGLAMSYLTATFGQTGGLYFMALVLPVIFCLMIGFLPIMINTAAMLMLTVATISHVQMHADFKQMFISLALGVAFFGLVFWGVGKLTAPKTPPAAAQA